MPRTATPGLTAAAVKPTSLPLAELFDTRYPARVPRYQRGYAWEDDHVDDLIQDVNHLFDEKPGTRGHFYGGMVAIAVPDASEARGSYYEVVDGQQRLTTFCLLLAELARQADELQEHAKSAGKTAYAGQFKVIGQEIRKSYLYYDRYDVNKGAQTEAPRLQLSTADDEVFQDLIAGRVFKPKRESHRLLHAASRKLAMELIDPHVSLTDLAASKKALVRLRDVVLRESFVIHIVGDNRSSGYRLFSVLNDRGARLTVADLLRSHTLEQLSSHSTILNRSAALWDELLNDGGEEVDEFLKSYYTSWTGRRAKQSELFDDVVALFFPTKPTSRKGAQKVLDTLGVMVEAFERYAAILEGEWPFPTKAKKSGPPVTAWQKDRLRRLVGTLRHELATPLLLAARDQENEPKFAELVHMLELFAFRYKNVCGAHATPASGAYYKECKRLRGLSAGASLNWTTLRADLRTLIEKRASDDTFRTSIQSKLRYDAGIPARSNIRELLSVIEDYTPWMKAGAKGAPVANTLVVQDLTQATLEHIYPQNPLTVDSKLELHTHRLGNMSYWAPGDNQAAGNDDFSAKKPKYKISSVHLNNDLSKLPTWDEATLEAREAELVDQACFLFRV